MSVFLSGGMPFYGAPTFPVPRTASVLHSGPRAVIEACRAVREDLVASAIVWLSRSAQASAMGDRLTRWESGRGGLWRLPPRLGPKLHEGHGAGDSPKFPQPIGLEFLLRHYVLPQSRP